MPTSWYSERLIATADHVVGKKNVTQLLFDSVVFSTFQYSTIPFFQMSKMI